MLGWASSSANANKCSSCPKLTSGLIENPELSLTVWVSVRSQLGVKAFNFVDLSKLRGEVASLRLAN